MSVKVLTENDRAAITREIEEAGETVTETIEDVIRNDMTVELSHVWEAVAEIRTMLCGFNRLLNGETPAFKEPPYTMKDQLEPLIVEDRGDPLPWIDSDRDREEVHD